MNEQNERIKLNFSHLYNSNPCELTSFIFIGESGSGKSTITSLLLRHYDTEGTIKIGGVDIKDLDPSTLREYVGTVSQVSVLKTEG